MVKAWVYKVESSMVKAFNNKSKPYTVQHRKQWIEDAELFNNYIQS